MTKMEEIPKRFWGTVTDDEFKEIAATGFLNAEQCARLWRMEDRNTEPPQRLQVFLKEKEVKKVWGIR